jgi:hypothetical protein
MLGQARWCICLASLPLWGGAGTSVANEVYRNLPIAFEPAPASEQFEAGFEARLANRPARFGHSGEVRLLEDQSAPVMRLAGAGPGVPASGLEPLPGKGNYLLGPDAAQWKSGIPGFRKIEYSGVYPRVDLIYYSDGGQLEYDFLLHPGAFPSAIRLDFGGRNLSVDSEGALIVESGLGRWRHHPPHIYQTVQGQQVAVSGGYRVLHGGQVGFSVGAYDTSRELRIDPVLSYASYLGGAGDDRVYAMAVDASGYIYLAGETGSASLPAGIGYQRANAGDRDAFVIKLNPAGTAVVYATYIGGGSRDSGRGLAVDGSGNAYLTGFTYSSNFPVTSGAWQTHPHGQEEAFALKLNPSGAGLEYSTYAGGAGSDFAMGAAVNSAGELYLCGYTSSIDFPVLASAAQLTFHGGYYDAFFVKLNASGSAALLSSYLGGSGNDTATAITTDAAGNAYFTGQTDSADFPATLRSSSALQSVDGFVAKVSASGQLSYLTRFGGRGSDLCNAVALDGHGNVYVAGASSSADLPVSSGAYQTALAGSYDAFVARLSATGSVTYLTYLGGGDSDTATALAVTPEGYAYVAGTTASFNFPVLAPAQASARANGDGFLAILNASGSALLWSSYLGGNGSDNITSVAVDGAGKLYLAGYTQSVDFPVTPDALSKASLGSVDGFLAILQPIDPPSVVSVMPNSGSGSVQTFGFTFSDPRGAASISAVYVVFNSTLSVANSCAMGYYPASNLLYLINNANSGVAGTVQLGVAGTVSNSQCTVNGGDSSVTRSGNTLTLKIQLTFQTSFAGSRLIYAYASDMAGLSSGWGQTGAWSVTGGSPPTASSVAPSSGTGSSQTFSFVFTDADSASDLAAVYVLINSTLNVENSCTMAYYPSANLLYLINNANTGVVGAVQPRMAGTVSNSQCTVNGGGGSVTRSGNTLTLHIQITFQSAFAGLRQIYTNAFDAEGLTSGWVQLGVWTVPGNAPAVISVTPGSGTGNSQTFSFVFTDADGASDLSGLYVLINSALSVADSCTMAYYPSSNLLYLINNANTGVAGSVQPGLMGTVSNSQCTVTGGGSSVTRSGNTLTLKIQLTFQTSFAGSRLIYANALDTAGLGSGWVHLGVWPVSGGNPPTATSVTPSGGTGSFQTFSFVFADSDGASDLTAIYVLINSALNVENACAMAYYPSGNVLYLINNANTGVDGAVQPGVAGTVANSQCSVNGGGSSVTHSGNTLTLQIQLTFQTAFAGARLVYASAFDTGGLGSGWVQLGAWTASGN